MWLEIGEPRSGDSVSWPPAPVELTECRLLDDIHDAVTRINELRNRRVRLSLDDCGTGYSSLSDRMLQPRDQLKIDRSCLMADSESTLRNVGR